MFLHPGPPVNYLANNLDLCYSLKSSMVIIWEKKKKEKKMPRAKELSTEGRFTCSPRWKSAIAMPKGLIVLASNKALSLSLFLGFQFFTAPPPAYQTDLLSGVDQEEILSRQIRKKAGGRGLMERNWLGWII